MISALTGAGKVKEPDKVQTVSHVNKNGLLRSARNDGIQATNAGELHETQPVYKGDPENQVIVFDMDETLIAGDKIPFTKERTEKINAMKDREIRTISKNDPDNKLNFDIKYVLRPGAKELLEYLTSRGYKIVVSTRNYGAYAEAICKKDPVLSKHVSGTLGREDLLKAENKDFKKYPHHPDRLGFWGRTKAILRNIFIKFPGHCWRKFKSFFNGHNVRWNPGVGTLGKYPPNMIELLKLKGNHKLDNCKPPRFLVDNKAVEREIEDSKNSGDFAVIDPNTDHNGDGKTTNFDAGDEVPKTTLIHNGESKEGFLWVKNVIQGIEKGWREQLKETTGVEPKV